MKHSQIVFGEPDFETFAFRELAGVSCADGTVTMAIKTSGPSIEIAMSRKQARQIALELMDMANRAGQMHSAPDEDFPPHLLPSK